MANEIQQILFTPSGGMNQDDSIVTPAPESESGKSLFQLGDYKYALNLRTGSSRSDNFGDGENIKDTLEVFDFYVYKSLVTNPEFTGSLTPWLETAGPSSWSYSSNKAVISTVGSGAFSSNVRYQSIATTGDKIYVSFSYTVTTGFNSGLDLRLVFLNGTTVISTVKINSLGIVPAETKRSIPFSLPAGCDAVGFQVTAVTSGTSSAQLDYFFVNGMAVGTKPTGDEKVIGKLEDSEFQRLYYCVWNSNGNHSIRYYDPIKNAVFELFRWFYLNFKEDSFVKMARLDNWIAFTDRVNAPRLIDVNYISEMFTILGSSNFREFHISFHKWAPTMPPVTKAYWDGATDNAEKLKDKVFQWAYRYVYKGNLKSRFSPTSVANNRYILTNGTGGANAKITAIELNIPGYILDDPGAVVSYNYFGHNDIKFLVAVDAIEIAYRDGHDELWRVFRVLENNGSFPTTVRFTGNSNSTPIAVDDFSQLFDTVPFLAGTVEAIDNRFVFGDCLDEHDPSSKPIITNIGTVSANPGNNINYWNSAAPAVFTGMPPADAIELCSRNGITNHSFKSRGLYKLAMIFQDHRGWVSGAYTTDEWMYEIPEGDTVTESQYALTFKISPAFKPPAWAVAYQIVRTNCLNISYFMLGLANKMTTLVDDVSKALDDIGTLQQSVKDRIAQHFENSRIVDGYEFSQEIVKETRRRSLMKYLLTNNISNRLRTEVRNTVAVNNVSDGSRIYIDINNWYNSSKADAGGSKNNPMNSLFYNYREGDRVRFTGSYNGSPSASQKQVFDELILEFTGKAIICKKPADLLWLPNYGDGAVTQPQDYVIEVYSPNVPSDEDYLYYENGEWNAVVFPMTDQRSFARTDWTYTNNAAVTVTTRGPLKEFEPMPFAMGDCTLMGKTNYRDFAAGSGSNVVTVFSTAMTNRRDEIWADWDHGNGRPSISYRDFPVVRFKLTTARFGGQIIEESFVNNLNRFVDQNQFTYPSEYGRIRDLVNTQNAQVESVGSILLGIGERETWAIYVNRITIEDLSGRTQVGLSNKVLGSFNALLGSHGTFNPESVSKKRGKVWFWDAINGSWVRYGRDGLTPISDNKMRTWFKELGDLLITQYSGGEIPKVISEFDPFHEELITRIDHSSLPEEFREYYVDYKGAVFSEKDVRWKRCHTYNPEMFGKINNQVVGFQNGNVVLLEKGEGYGIFFGNPGLSIIEPVFTNLISIQTWQTIAVVASHKWGANQIISEYRGSKFLQNSTLFLNDFEEREDNFWAAILNDRQTIISDNPLYEGDRMRSKAIRVMLQLQSDVYQKSLLHYVAVGHIDSRKNPVN